MLLLSLLSASLQRKNCRYSAIQALQSVDTVYNDTVNTVNKYNNINTEIKKNYLSIHTSKCANDKINYDTNKN